MGNGSKAFSTEYQNEPIDRESMLFDPETFHYYDPDLNFKSGQFNVFLGIDFAMGKKERGDYSALVVLAQNKRTRTMYVAEAIENKLHPDKFLDLIVDKVVEWQPDRIAADANVAQEFLVWTLRQRLKAVNYPEYTRVKEIKNRTRKELRIEAMHPDIEGGKILFNKRHSLLLEQFEKYGTNGHDDLLDAQEMAVSIARTGGPQEIIEKPWWM
ncbi:phage terminase large subunit [Seinonella peptonophila]|nr:phage terminase large subunit [Seinonella peptonophila]